MTSRKQEAFRNRKQYLAVTSHLESFDNIIFSILALRA